MKKLMRYLAHLFPSNSKGENPIVVKLFYTLSLIIDFFKLMRFKKSSWPVYSGSYKVINPNGLVAICTLTSDYNDFVTVNPIAVAIVGKVYTPNLGIEKIILNTISNPSIRYLLLCGKDSSIFKVGQAIQCLFNYGINLDKRINHAEGHFPVLNNISEKQLSIFLQQIELINCIDEIKVEVIQDKIAQLDLKKKRFNTTEIVKNVLPMIEETSFIPLKTGGKRIPLNYDLKGFFVISTDLTRKEIIVHHYNHDHSPGYIIKGRFHEPILLAILENGLVSQMSHAGYLGSELMKAEISIKQQLPYKQDQPLNSNTSLKKIGARI